MSEHPENAAPSNEPKTIVDPGIDMGMAKITPEKIEKTINAVLTQRPVRDSKRTSKPAFTADFALMHAIFFSPTTGTPRFPRLESLSRQFGKW